MQVWGGAEKISDVISCHKTEAMAWVDDCAIWANKDEVMPRLDVKSRLQIFANNNVSFCVVSECQIPVILFSSVSCAR